MNEVELRDELGRASRCFALIADIVDQWAQPTYANEKPSSDAMVGLVDMAGDMRDRCAKASMAGGE